MDAFPLLRPTYENIGSFLNKLGDCLEKNSCVRGFVLSSSVRKIRFVESGPYYDLVMRFKEQIASGNSSFSDEELSRHGLTIDLMNRNYELFVGVRRGSYFVTSRRAAINIIEDGLHSVPFLFLYSHSIVINYLRVLKSLEVALPHRINDCSVHAKRTGCYRYIGSTECIFNYVSRCPLRILLRGSKEQRGGALPLLDNYLSRISPVGPRDFSFSESHLDYLLTTLLLEILYLVSWKAAVETGRLMNIDVYIEKRALGSQSLLMSLLNIKARRALSFMLDSLNIILKLDDPYQARTRLILYLESLPKFLRIIGDHVSSMDVYSFCRQSVVDERVVRGLIEYYYPFLKGKVAEAVSREISKILYEDGCVEPREISNGISNEMALKILEVLAQKNILRKVPRKGHPIFVAYHND
jgi:hypothetical protein